MSVRAIRRNIVKRKVGSNKIRRVWRNMQIKKFGWLEWLLMYKKCKARSMTKDTIYMI